MTTAAPDKASRRRELMLGLALMCASIIAGLLLVEITLRVATPKEVMRYFFMSPDPILHHRFEPHATGRYQTVEFDTEYRINSLGLRDHEFTQGKPPGTFRILMLGDSFTEGDGVETNQTFSKLIEAALDSLPSPLHYEVINAGVGSYSTILHYLYLTHGGLALNPDLVILNFDLSDVYDDIRYTKLARFDSNGVPLGVSPAVERPSSSPIMRALVGIKDFFKEHTRLYNFIRIRIDRYLEGARHEGNFSGDIRFDKYAMLRESYEPRDGRDWKLSFHYLMMIRDLLQSRGIDFWVTVYPYGLQISPKEWNAGRQFWGFTPDKLYTAIPQDQLVSFCKGNDIRIVNMIDDFRRAARSVFPLYLDYNGHWRPEGHQVVARALLKELRPYLRRHELTITAAAQQGSGTAVVHGPALNHGHQ